MASKTADHHPAPANGMDYPEHNRTYSGFITGVKWSCYGGAALMIILYFLIIH
ncbi:MULTISPECIES: aa3-type cytochrome c oxidase subunit IV [unclassified Devosia]|uniref:aa3-type cytochrome c oxidase subunit IV n=1 Tax=unclassified Devosia TaxID=196773 RepID=UPI00145E1A9E|nr:MULTISPECIES: aa3-type cytochrome c oxidase subunit IV [unclassified Devosia]MBJ6988682.1 aa3-type cytochrome c oxidase subunit IV [Devosia sp. MC521]MBJ7578314.1 aa3-type cytochrome c oxidase subunit IV [Devosia sp. MC532]MBK1794842.1 aa3-type cytochrome c oxidase subunit IV [Devosia sp. WQ 349K1]QMW62178.1 aa3-type cytochrome c oxidase subunit IV [Devosia sp. MC521]